MAYKRKPPKNSFEDLVARRFAAARRAFNANRAEVARVLGNISPGLLEQYESGEAFPRPHHLVRFCALAGCSSDWIYLGRISPNMDPLYAARIAAEDPELLGFGPAETVAVVERAVAAREEAKIEAPRPPAAKPAAKKAPKRHTRA